MAKPSTLPDWDTTGVNAVEPDATHKAEGWLAPGGVPEKPPFQTFNHWMNAVWKWIKEFAQQGIVEWDGGTTYQIDDIAKGSDGLLYRSLIGANTNNDPLTNLDKWIDIQWRNQTVPITFPSDADYTLTDDENAYGRILISGAVISTARNLIVNNIQKTLIVQNDEAFDVTVKTAAGTGILIPAGTSADLYNDGVNVIRRVQEPSTGKPGFSAYLSATTVAVTSGVSTKINIDTEEYDITGAYDNATNFRFQPLVPGYYQVNAQLYAGSSSFSRLVAQIYKNGALYKRGSDTTIPAANTNQRSVATTTVFLNGSTDYVDLYALAVGTSPVVLGNAIDSSFFQAHFIQGA